VKKKIAAVTTTVDIKTKIDNATKGLTPTYSSRLGTLPPKQISVICDYISALRSEIKLSDTYRQSILNTLIPLSRTNKKGFKDFIRTDVITYLDKYRKDDKDDPSHKWIGTHNTNVINIIKFFRWLYYPGLEPKERPKPKVVQNLRTLKRREVSGYKPADMWNAEDNLLFLKYCPNPRDRCYHAIESDLGARPHELLKLRIKDVEFIDDGGGRYARVVLNGKTGERVVPLIESIPYVTQWISNHPQGSNREAFLLPNIRTGEGLAVDSLQKAYTHYKLYFAELLNREDVPFEDKQKIEKLLRKRWNPYVHRHSAITEKSGMLSSDAKLRQYAGWTPRSNMHYKYVHFSGGESMKDLLKAKGIIKEDKHSVNILQPKTCPHCKEPNKPDAQFCFKCSFVMSFEVYQKGMEEREKKDHEILELKEQMSKMQQDYKSYDDLVKEVFEKAKQHIDGYRKQQEKEDETRRMLYGMLDREFPGWHEKYLALLGFGPPKDPKEFRKRLDEFLEKIKHISPNTDNADEDEDIDYIEG